MRLVHVGRASSLMPNIAPTANTPAAMLNTVRSVRVLLCQMSNQILYQIIPQALMPGLPAGIRLRFSLRSAIWRSRSRVDFRLVQQFVELIVADGQHFHGSAFRGAHGSLSLAVVEKCHLAEKLSGSELPSDHIRLIRARQHNLHRAFGNDIKCVSAGSRGHDHGAGPVDRRFCVCALPITFGPAARSAWLLPHTR